MRLCSVPLVWLRGVKDSAKRLFLGGAGQNGGAILQHQPPGYRNIFAAIAASDVYECIAAVNQNLKQYTTFMCKWGYKNIIAIIPIQRIIVI